MVTCVELIVCGPVVTLVVLGGIVVATLVVAVVPVTPVVVLVTPVVVDSTVPLVDPVVVVDVVPVVPMTHIKFIINHHLLTPLMMYYSPNSAVMKYTNTAIYLGIQPVDIVTKN